MEKKSKTVALQTQQTEQNKQTKQAEQVEIPFVKPARIGNFKLWRSKKYLGLGRNKYEIEQINISNLDGTWQLKIPATFQIFGLIGEIYKAYKTDGTDGHAEGQLATLFGNMLYASAIGNGYFHRALNMLATVYANPGLLEKKDESHKDFMKDVKELVERFLEWRKEYDRQSVSLASTDEELRQAQVADEMLDEIKMEQSESGTVADGDRKKD